LSTEVIEPPRGAGSEWNDTIQFGVDTADVNKRILVEKSITQGIEGAQSRHNADHVTQVLDIIRVDARPFAR
jgi:hypothetical protein